MNALNADMAAQTSAASPATQGSATAGSAGDEAGCASSHAAETLIGCFGRHGYARIDVPVLQPSELFIELSGEDLQRRLFLTQDAQGHELCLRPEFTIPVCREHLARHGGSAAAPAAYAYLGPVFRTRAGESGEFLQAGIESIGRSDIAAADADVLALALCGLTAMGEGSLRVRIGDMGLLGALLDALKVTPAVKRRLTRNIAAGRGLAELNQPPAEMDEHAGLLAAIEGQDRNAARAFVEDVIAIAGIAPVGGRSASEIAERFLSRAANRSGGLPDEAREVLRRYLAIAGNPDEAVARLRSLAGEAGLDLGQALDLFEERTGFMAAAGLEIADMAFATDFARNLDYYTGFIFEILGASLPADKPIVGGGRYDRLLSHLGHPEPVPAIGCSFWLDRLSARTAS